MRKFRLYFFLSVIFILALIINSSQFWGFYALAFKTEEYRLPVISKIITEQEHEASLDLKGKRLLGVYSLYLEVSNLEIADGREVSLSCVVVCDGEDVRLPARGVAYNGKAKLRLTDFSFTLLESMFAEKEIFIKDASLNLLGTELLVLRDY